MNKKIGIFLFFVFYFWCYALLSIVNADTKNKLTILNAGSKTGSFAMQMTAISKDLQKYYDIDLKIPGDYCTAVQMLKSIKLPILMPWANDFEAIGRDGSGCATFDVKPVQVVRYGTTVMYVCSMNHDADSLMKNDHAVGHTTPVGPFSRAVLAINDSFGTKLKPIAYDGSGATKTGLYNGEVDYALLSAKHGQKVIKNGGQCFYEFSTNENSPYIALANLDPSNKFLNMSMDDVWIALNMNANETEKLRKLIRTIHNDSSSAIYEYIGNRGVPTIIWDLSDDEITKKWQLAVENLQESK